MYHAHFRGTHYEAGFRWGSLLLKHKNIILENIPFEITQERIDYALSCLPIYEKHYHEIVEEIQGLADGQQCDVRILQAVLFSMYSMPPSCNCSCFAFTTEQEILLGRFYYQKSSTELGRQMNLSPGNVRMIQKRALEKLRMIMEKQRE